MLHDTKVMLNILQVNKQRHFVIVDSFFDSVQACDELKKRGLRFIGDLKKATIDLCMANLSDMDLAWRGLCKGYFALNNEKKLEKFSFIWVDRDRGI